VQIREWNDLNSFLTSNANAGTLGGTEPGYLDETGSLFPINDYADWRDFFAVPGSFPGKP
jgi:hypothetical protein